MSMRSDADGCPVTPSFWRGVGLALLIVAPFWLLVAAAAVWRFA